ncbi:flagellar protein FlaG [Methylobacterium sp. BTF04]|uniref:flagellar protein FlaG n=1 Tax=Methylobacterium sp. BTF04 TaxID=2708300 RepID=UPI0013D657F6|nr:flagellar protein FlaG [Methylobacterium sp. BTF04]NEU13281.1 flagellar protein FlaG [Methylobacterium sp. BTF04]
MSISSISAVTPIRPPTPSPAPAQPADSPAALAPAVRIDIRKPETARDANPEKTKAGLPSDEAVDRRNSIDPDTKTIVYQVVDQASGDVVVQIPDAVVLKTRAYVEAQAARTQKAERPLDRTA